MFHCDALLREFTEAGKFRVSTYRMYNSNSHTESTQKPTTRNGPAEYASNKSLVHAPGAVKGDAPFERSVTYRCSGGRRYGCAKGNPKRRDKPAATPERAVCRRQTAGHRGFHQREPSASEYSSRFGTRWAAVFGPLDTRARQSYHAYRKILYSHEGFSVAPRSFELAGETRRASRQRDESRHRRFEQDC